MFVSNLSNTHVKQKTSLCLFEKPKIKEHENTHKHQQSYGIFSKTQYSKCKNVYDRNRLYAEITDGMLVQM